MFGFLTKFLSFFDRRKLLNKKDIARLEVLIGHKIKSPDIYIQAFTHRSVLDHKRFSISNERLEFLGDAVLGMIVSEYLFSKYTDFNEGDLTKMRANLVNKNSLFMAADKINLFEFMYINKDLMMSDRFGFHTVLADAFEALIGAIYIDIGYNAASDFVTSHLIHPHLRAGRHLVDDNFKSRLLEYVQSQHWEMPKYVVTNEEGPEHDRIFTVRVNIGSRTLGTGKGRNKKSAEQKAAKKTLELLHDL